MKVKKTFRYRIYPTAEQAVLLAKHFGARRFVFNHFLNQRKTAYLENRETLNYYDNASHLTAMKKEPGFEWMREINSQSLQASLRDLDVAYNRFFRKQARFPRFKSRHDHQSFRVPQFVRYESGWLTIPKFKQPIKVKEDRPLEGEILFATLRRNRTGKYFVCIACESEHASHPETDKQVGIDLGLKDLVICSDGTKFDNPRAYRQRKKKLAYAQRQVAKKQKGSSRRSKARHCLAKIYEKSANVRQDCLHQISSRLVRENQTICFESLAVKNMMKNHCLAGSIGDAGWGELIRQVKYKSEWNGRTAVEIDRFFPSSKLCGVCGFINQDLTLKDREWTCPRCQTWHDRDLNAANNILAEGLRILSGCGTQSDTKQKPEEASSLEESVSQETPSSLAAG